ncbi:MAG TPA: hypothetical protein VMU05_03760 [Dongiaceae bacterium]|nr:hypothetical protein [Dongiaceae bacterium]
MIAPNYIPTLDPNPLPAPYWVFKLLLLVTFFLHILAMNFMLGGAVLALVARRAKNREQGNRMFADIAKKLPSLLPATITIGIAPLLFLQVLYGQFFYTSSVIVAWPWFLVLICLTLAYYGFYYTSFKGSQYPDKAKTVMSFSLILVFIIGFIYSNNLTLSQTPSRWAEKYFADPGGWNLNWSEPTLIPRFLHFFVAAVAMGGLLLVFIALAKWNRDREYARGHLQLGGKAFMFATMAQFLIGIWFLATLPKELRMLFLGDSAVATILLMVGLVGGGASIFLMSAALQKENVRFAAYSVSSIIGVVILSMSIMRDMLRDAYLKPYYHPDQFVVRTQWTVFPLFLGLFIAGVILWLVMLKRYFSNAKSGKEMTAAAPALLEAVK